MTPALPLRQRHLLRLERRPNELVFRRGMRPKDAPNDGEPPGDPPFQIVPFAFAGRDAVDLAAQFRHVVLERAQGPAEAVVEVDDFDEGAVSEEVFGAAGGFAGDGFGGGRVVVAVVVALVALVVLAARPFFSRTVMPVSRKVAVTRLLVALASKGTMEVTSLSSAGRLKSPQGMSRSWARVVMLEGARKVHSTDVTEEVMEALQDWSSRKSWEADWRVRSLAWTVGEK
mmetsp:Transcript_1956/g.3921  ORF Transcript_1956/g.3921 Transcript_1956/m.3921 type:complete len:229 (+) Transcript_1956:2-688(+)